MSVPEGAVGWAGRKERTLAGGSGRMSQQPLGMQAVLGYGGENIHYGGDDSCMFPSGTTVRKVNYEGGVGGGGAGGGGRGQGGGNTHIPCEGLGVGTMCVHPSLQSFAYCEKGKGAVVRICDMASGAVQHTIEGAADIDVDILTFTSDGSALLTVAGLPDFKVTIWDWMKGVELVQGPAPSKMNTAMFNPVNPDQMLFTTPDDSMFVCNVVAGAQGPEFDFEKFSPPSEELLFTSCTFTEEGVVHCTTSDGCLWVGDPVSGTVVGESVVISAEGAKCHVVATGRHLICWTSTGVVVWLGLETMSEGYRVKIPVRSSDSLISICHGQSSVFVGSKEGNIFQIRLLQDIPDGTYREEEEEPSPVTVKDADALIGEVQFDSHHQLHRIVVSHSGPVTGACALPNMRSFATAGADGMLHVWDAISGDPVAGQRIGRPLTTMTAHPNMSLVCVGDDMGVVKIVDLATPSRIRARFTTRLFDGPVSAASFSFDGSLLAIGGKNSPDLYIISLGDKDGGGAPSVVGFVKLPESGVNGVCWTGMKSVVAAGVGVHVFEAKELPVERPEEGLQLDVKIACIKAPGRVGGVTNGSAGVVMACEGDRATRVFAKGAWMDLDSGGSLEGVAAGQQVSDFLDHDKMPGFLAVTPDGDSVGSCGSDGMVVIRTGAGLSKVMAARCFSVWNGGATAMALQTSGSSALAMVGGTRGTLVIVSSTPDLSVFLGRAPDPASSIAKQLLDNLGEPVEAEQPRTFADLHRMSDLEMQNALNAARKNETREQLRKLKATFDQLLELNEAAPEIERIPREEIVLDKKLRESIIQDGDVRVRETQAKVKAENLAKDTMTQRIKELAWDSMSVHGTELMSFTTGQICHNFPIRIPSEEEKEILDKVRMQRRIEIAMHKASKKELGMSNSLIELGVADSTTMTIAAEAKEGEVGEEAAQQEGIIPDVDDVDEVWTKAQDDPCMYHRFEVSTRERKTSQIIMVQDAITRGKTRFNAQFDEFMKRKIVVLGKIEEKNARIAEIQEELSSTEPLFNASLQDSEQPDRVLTVEDSEVTVPRWVSKEELRQKAEEEARSTKKGPREAAAERALLGMMGGTLAGEAKVNKLNEEFVKPSHLIPAEGEELTEDQTKELKEWEAMAKALEAEKEVYRKALEGEAKKLRSEIMEECKKFDDGMQELLDARLKTDYKAYEQELYKIKLIQAVAQEEDDIAASIALKKSLSEMDERREVAARAVDDFSGEVQEAERTLEVLRADAANMERLFRKELVDSAQIKDLADVLLKVYRKRGDFDDVPPGLGDEVMERAQQHLSDAVEQDGRVAEAQSALEAVRGELDRLTWALKQMDDAIHAAEEELHELETRMMSAGSDLDLTFMLKQGQVEVEQAAVATDFSDAEIVEKGVINANNSLITNSGSEKVSILHEIKDFRKGIHQLQWENSRLDLEEEELLQRTKDLQLLRVTKGLQSIIKGSDEGKTAQENSSLEKLVSYQTKVHGQRVKEKAKLVEGLTVQTKVAARENSELDEDIFALESAVVERQRLCELQGTTANQGEGRAKKSEKSKMNMMVTHRKLLDLAKAQTREIELMREELVRLRAKTFPSFAQLSQSALPDSLM